MTELEPSGNLFQAVPAIAQLPTLAVHPAQHLGHAPLMAYLSVKLLRHHQAILRIALVNPC
jgi:hypothetical protein